MSSKSLKDHKKAAEALTFKQRVSLLNKLGFEFRVYRGYKDSPSGRVPYEADLFEDVFLKLSVFEWTQACQVQGQFNLHGCCGNLSQVQSILTSAFLEGGWLSCQDLAKLADGYANHDGGEPFRAPAKSLNTLVNSLKKDLEDKKRLTGKLLVDPWRVLAVVWHIVDGAFNAERAMRYPNIKIKPIDEAARIIESTIRSVSWDEMVFGAKNAPKPHEVQLQASRLMQLARLLPALNTFNNNISAFLGNTEPVEAVGIVHVNDPDNVVTNGYGYCILTEEAAQNLIKSWALADDEIAESRHVPADQFKLRKVRVSLEKGLEFLP